jgi:putative ABC transport system permease protein
VALIVAHGTSPESVVKAAHAAHLGSYLRYATPSKELRTSQSSIAGQLAPFFVLQRALLLVSFISVLSTLLLVGVQRRREFGLLGAVGMTPKELFRMVVAEALAVGVVAAVLGSILGFLLLDTLLDVTPLVIGYHDTYSPDVISLAVYAPIAVIVAVIASLWPGWQAARTPILEALKYE